GRRCAVGVIHHCAIAGVVHSAIVLHHRTVAGVVHHAAISSVIHHGAVVLRRGRLDRRRVRRRRLLLGRRSRVVHRRRWSVLLRATGEQQYDYQGRSQKKLFHESASEETHITLFPNLLHPHGLCSIFSCS